MRDDFALINAEHLVTVHDSNDDVRGREFSESWFIEGTWGLMKSMSDRDYFSRSGHNNREEFVFEIAFKIRFKACVTLRHAEKNPKHRTISGSTFYVRSLKTTWLSDLPAFHLQS
jgi:hypothetical protein